MEWKNGGEGGRWKVERWGEWVGEIIVEAEELNKIKKRGARGEGRGARGRGSKQWEKRNHTGLGGHAGKKRSVRGWTGGFTRPERLDRVESTVCRLFPREGTWTEEMKTKLVTRAAPEAQQHGYKYLGEYV